MIKETKQSKSAKSKLEREFLLERQFLTRRRIKWNGHVVHPVPELLPMVKGLDITTDWTRSLADIVRHLYTGPTYYYEDDNLKLDESQTFQCGPQKLLSLIFGPEMFKGLAKRGKIGHVHLYRWLSHSYLFAAYEANLLLAFGLTALEIELVLRALGRTQTSQIFHYLRHNGRIRLSMDEIYLSLKWMNVGVPEVQTMGLALRVSLGKDVMFVSGDGTIGHRTCKITDDVTDDDELLKGFKGLVELKIVQKMKLPYTSVASAIAGILQSSGSKDALAMHWLNQAAGLVSSAVQQARNKGLHSEANAQLLVQQVVAPPMSLFDMDKKARDHLLNLFGKPLIK